MAGLLALLCTIDPSMDLFVARHVLRVSSNDIGDEGWDSDSGYGVVNALEAYSEYISVLDGTATVEASSVEGPALVAARMSQKDLIPAGDRVPQELQLALDPAGEEADPSLVAVVRVADKGEEPPPTASAPVR